MLKNFLRFSLLAVTSLGLQRIHAQNPAENNMASIIYGLQTGSMNWNRFYPALKGVIAAQTGGTGKYTQLAMLGSPMNVTLVKNIPLPGGFYYEFRTFFSAGEVDWQVASDFQGNIAGLAFFAGNSQSPLPPAPGPPQPSNPAPIVSKGDTPKTIATASDACQSFPLLCPQ